jgi:hypothetical protein
VWELYVGWEIGSRSKGGSASTTGPVFVTTFHLMTGYVAE